MADVKNWDLEDGVSESFVFTFKGYEYKFKYLTTEDLADFQGMKDIYQFMEFISQFITPIDDKSPKFEEIYKKMSVKHLEKFSFMIKTEMTPSVEPGNGNS